MSFSFRNLFKKEDEEGFEPRPLSGGRTEGPPDIASLESAPSGLSGGERFPAGFAEATPGEGLSTAGGEAAALSSSRMRVIPGEGSGEQLPASPFSSMEPVAENTADAPVAGGEGPPPFGSIFVPPTNASPDGGSPFTPVEPETGTPFVGEPFSSGAVTHEQVSGPIPGF
jgi:hypothetical protein